MIDTTVLPTLVATVDCEHCPPFDLTVECDPGVYRERGLIAALDERDAGLDRTLRVHMRQHGGDVGDD